ncbi:MAG: tetratricopeptide repeat protein [Gemmatimonadota bacterium]|nr:MAG: tetratricopeptide repeat protein [Gemmatimonadota bacterium]
MKGLKGLIGEIHRRSLWQVLGIYLLGSWVALQVVDVLANNFGLPQWFPAFALALLVIGLPVVLATAFVQQGVGLREASTDSAPREAGRAPAMPQATGGRLLTWRYAISGGVLAFALWGVVAAGWLVLRAGVRAEAGAPGDRRSVAVLPFASVHTDEESQAFTSGIHDDLLTQLSKIENLTVISRTSVQRFRDTDMSIPQIAEELGVAAVVEGGVQRAGDRVRVNVQLIDARTDRHLWAETYDEQLTVANVFAIQSDLARKIAGALQATLTPEEEQRIGARPTESLEAYQLYTRGRYVLNSRGSTREGVESAADLFRQAVAADSTFAPAHVGVADTYFQLWSLGYVHETEALPQAEAAAERALALDPDLAEARALLGSLLRVERRLEEAEREFLRAIELNPGSSAAHRGYSALLFELGRADESLEEAERAVELDPLSAGARRSLLSRLIWAKQYDEAIRESRKLLEIEPNEADAYYYAAIAYTERGEHDVAIKTHRKAMELNPADPYYPAGLAHAYARAAIGDSAVLYLQRAEEAGVPLKEIAFVYAALGDLDRAFEYLDRAYATEPGTLAGIGADTWSAPLQADPRWFELLRKLGLP